MHKKCVVHFVGTSDVIVITGDWFDSILYRALQIAESYSYTVEPEDPACEIANDAVSVLQDLIGVACCDDD